MTSSQVGYQVGHHCNDTEVPFLSLLFVLKEKEESVPLNFEIIILAS